MSSPICRSAATSNDLIMEKKYKELHYKRAVLHGAKGTLQHMLEAVLKQLPLPKDRLENLGLNGDEGRVMVHEHHHQAILCATMTTYEKGALQPIMGIAPESKDWPIKQVEPPKLPGAKETEFLDGYLFLGVWKNSVIFLPSRSCSSEHLEDYLNSLLRKKEHWPSGAYVSLDDRPPQSVREKKFQHIQAFNLQTTLGAKTGDMQAEQAGAVQKASATVTTQHFKPDGAAWGAITSLIEMLGGKLPEDVLLESDFDPNDVRIKLEVTCAKRKLEKAGQIMDVMANSLRHVTTDVVRFTFEDGTELKGSDLKTHKKFYLECSGAMPVPQQVDKAIHAYLQELVEKGTVDGEE